MAEHHRVPNVIGIGAEKCGTTSLHYYLRAHPEIGVQANKEMRFFVDGPGGRWHRGVAWYARQFPSDRRVLVESHGGGYTAVPRDVGVPERIRSVAPDARFIYLVRDPVDRLVSRWVHNYSNHDEHRPIDEALLDFDDVEYVPQSRYGFQLEQYLRHFPVDRFLVVDHHDLLRDRPGTLGRIFEFLGVRQDFWSPEFDIVRHASAPKRRLTPIGSVLHEMVGRQLLRPLGNTTRHRLKRVFYGPFSRPIPRPRLDAAVRARLREVFQRDRRRLEDIAGRRFEQWLA